MTLNFNGRVAIVTGAGGGLGREHALALAARGAKVVVNDLGGARDGSGSSLSAAQAVVEEIRAAGGEAIANGASVTDFAAVQAMVAETIAQWGRVDILINNAGILRDKSFAKMDIDDFKLVMDVHLMGAVHCCKAVWPVMTEQKYGRIVMTTSSSGLYGNFGQSNYGAAKMALVGLMQTQALKPSDVVPAMLVLAAEDAPTRAILCAGAGSFEAANITLTQGVFVGRDSDAPEQLAARLSEVRQREGETVPDSGTAQGHVELTKAMSNLQKN